MRRYLSNQCAKGVALAIAATTFSPVVFSQSESAVLEEVLAGAFLGGNRYEDVWREVRPVAVSCHAARFFYLALGPEMPPVSQR